MFLLWEWLFPFALPFLTFAEANGGTGDEGDGDGEDSEDGDRGTDSDEEDEDREDEEGSDEADAKDLKAALIATRSALKKANAEAKERRLKLKKFEDEEAARQKANMSDLEKAQTSLAEVTSERDQLRMARVDREINHAISLEALRLGFADPEDALNLVDMGEIEVDKETFKVNGVAEALKKLIKAKPYLLKGEEDGDGHGTPRKVSKRKGTGKETLPERSMAVL